MSVWLGHGAQISGQSFSGCAGRVFLDEVSITSLSVCPKSSHPLFPGHLQRFALPTEAPALPWSSAPRLGSRLVSGVASVTPRRSCPLGLGRRCSATDPGSGETGPLPQRTPDASFFLTFTDSNHLLSLLSLLQFIQFSIGKKKWPILLPKEAHSSKESNFSKTP